MTPDKPQPDYRLWVSDDSTILVRLWYDHYVEVATRPHRDAIWGPPTKLHEQQP